MISERLVRVTLALSAPFNLFAAFLFAVPGSAPARLAGLPPEAPVVYRAITAFLVAFFGLTYAWLSTRRPIDRPLLTFAATGKLGVFIVATLLFLTGAIPFSLLLLGSGDLLFGAIWAWWLVATRREA